MINYNLHINKDGQLISLLEPLNKKDDPFFFNVIGLKTKGSNTNSFWQFILK